MKKNRPLEIMKKITFLILLSIIFSTCSNDRKVFDKAKRLISENKIDSALVYIRTQKEIKADEIRTEFVEDGNRDVNKLMNLIDNATVTYEYIENSIVNSSSLEYAKKIIVDLSDDDIKKLKNGNLKKSFLNPQKLNENFINLLRSEVDNRDAFVKERDEKARKEEIFLEERRKYSEESYKKEREDNYRKENVEKQFSKWDGSHIKLTKLIKDNMHDPDSYEHIETKFRDNKDFIFVTTKYRGKNALGAKVINTTSVNTDIDGNIIEILD